MEVLDRKRKRLKRKFSSEARQQRKNIRRSNGLLGLPEEVVTQVFSYCGALDLLNLTVVNSGLRLLASCDEIWHPLYDSTWAPSVVSPFSVLTLPSSFYFTISQSSFPIFDSPTPPEMGPHGIVAFLRVNSASTLICSQNSLSSTPKNAFLSQHWKERSKLGFSRIDAEILRDRIERYRKHFEMKAHLTLQSLIRDVLSLSRWFAILFRLIHTGFTRLQLALQTCYDHVYQLIRDQNALKLGVNAYTRLSERPRLCSLRFLVVEFLGSVRVNVPNSLLVQLDEIKIQSSWLKNSIEFLSETVEILITSYHAFTQKVSQQFVCKESAVVEESLYQMAETYTRTRNLIVTWF